MDTRTMPKNVVAFAVSQQIGSVSPNASSPAFAVPPWRNEKSVTSDVSTQQPTSAFVSPEISALSSAFVDGLWSTGHATPAHSGRPGGDDGAWHIA